MLTRSEPQVRSHAQKHFLRVSRLEKQVIPGPASLLLESVKVTKPCFSSRESAPLRARFFFFFFFFFFLLPFFSLFFLLFFFSLFFSFCLFVFLSFFFFFFSTKNISSSFCRGREGRSTRTTVRADSWQWTRTAATPPSAAEPSSSPTPPSASSARRPTPPRAEAASF